MSGIRIRTTAILVSAAIAIAGFGAKAGKDRADLGVIDKSKIADSFAVGASPLDKISTLEQVEFVMKSGVEQHPNH
jgi:imidazolonepropionase-like amidohydrolase